jgi:hypothetical protein
MSKLLQRLQDASRSGVYRVRRDAELREVLRDGGPQLHGVSLAGIRTKDDLFERLAAKLEFPQYFGGNWDAVQDCLRDLSWFDADGHVLLFEDFSLLPAAELGTLLEVLAQSARDWAAAGEPFFAAFIDAEAKLALPDLFREK